MGLDPAKGGDRTLREFLLLQVPAGVNPGPFGLMAGLLARGGLLYYLDGANSFDPHTLARLIQAHGEEPRAALRRVLISRAFTCHQLEALVRDRLPQALSQRPGALVIVAGLTELFFDEAVPAKEAWAILGRIAWSLREVARERAPVLATHQRPELPSPRMERFLPLLYRAAHRVAVLDEGLLTFLDVRKELTHGTDCRHLHAPPRPGG